MEGMVEPETFSDVINRGCASFRLDREPITDADVTFVCVTCGRSASADTTVTVREGETIYLCPHDGYELASSGNGSIGYNTDSILIQTPHGAVDLEAYLDFKGFAKGTVSIDVP